MDRQVLRQGLSPGAGTVDDALFGQLLRQRRGELGWTQQEVVSRSGLGVP
jgi:hypothetical protein